MKYEVLLFGKYESRSIIMFKFETNNFKIIEDNNLIEGMFM
jgi:hypothetical protein